VSSGGKHREGATLALGEAVSACCRNNVNSSGARCCRNYVDSSPPGVVGAPAPQPQAYRIRVATTTWVIAKYLYDHSLRRVTTAELARVLGSRNPYSLSRAIRGAIRHGIIRRLRKGYYEVNREAVLRVVRMIPYGVRRRVMNMSAEPEWREALELARAWSELVRLGDRAPEGLWGGNTSPPRRGARFLVEGVRAPGGQLVKVAVLGDLHVVLSASRLSSPYVYCLPFPSLGQGARLCASDRSALQRYLDPPPEAEGSQAPGRLPYLLHLANEVARSVMPSPMPPQGDGSVRFVFDNVRYVTPGGEEVQLKGLQPIEVLQDIRASGGRLVYYEVGIQLPPNQTLAALASLMDVHIYHSPGKDPPGVVRVETRPREGVASRYDPLGLLDLGKGYLYKVCNAVMAAIEADSNGLRV